MSAEVGRFYTCIGKGTREESKLRQWQWKKIKHKNLFFLNNKKSQKIYPKTINIYRNPTILDFKLWIIVY